MRCSSGLTRLRSLRCAWRHGQPPLQQLTNSVYQPLLSQRFDQECVSTSVACAPVRRENAEYENDRIREFRILLDRTAQRQSVQLRNHDFRNDDRGMTRARELQRSDI